MRHEPQSVLQPDSHYMLINWSNLNHKWLQLAGDTYSYPKMGTIAHAGPIVGVSPLLISPLSSYDR